MKKGRVKSKKRKKGKKGKGRKKKEKTAYLYKLFILDVRMKK